MPPILTQYALDSVDILRQSLILYDGGHENFYRVIAVQLRLLLCDTSFRHNRHVDTALIPMLLPELRLQPLDDDGHPCPDALPLELHSWLDSPAVPGSGLTIRRFIRNVCDLDGGTHVDIKPLAGLSNNESSRQWLISLARYLTPVLTAALSA